MDLIAALASPLPTTVICELFGIPHHDREHVIAWFRQLTNPTDGFERVELAVEQFEGYLAGLVGRRLLITAGDVTTTNLIGNGTLALLLIMQAKSRVAWWGEASQLGTA